MCKDFKEIYSFDMFGNFLSTSGTIGSCYNWVEVDFISIVSVSVNSCEVLSNGFKTVVQKPLFEVARDIRDYGRFLGTMFNILHADDIGKFNQILFVYSKGILPKDILGKKCINCIWSPLVSG